MKIRENTIIVRKNWDETQNDSELKKKIKEHFEKFGKFQMYFGWLYTGEEGAEIEFDNKEMKEKALAEDFENFEIIEAPEPPNQDDIAEMKKKMNLERKKFHAALHASKNSGRYESNLFLPARARLGSRFFNSSSSSFLRYVNFTLANVESHHDQT